MNTIRKILLKLATKIYNKYSFQEIREGQRFVFKDDIFVVMRTSLKQDPECVDVLKVELHKRQSLQSYISEKIRGNDRRVNR